VSDSAGRVVAWQWERFVSYGIGGGGHWEIEWDEEHPEILFQEDLKDPKKYRNLHPLVPEQLLVDCEGERDDAIGWRDTAAARVVELQNNCNLLNARLDLVRALADECDGIEGLGSDVIARRLRALTETPSEERK
jgi:hypothetical protein